VRPGVLLGFGMIEQAFVLGAGLGTRLRPLTDDVPKPLMPIFQKPLITFALDHLMAAGVERFVINTHHLAGRLEAFFAAGTYRDRPIRLVHEPDLLETGGGIKNAEALLGHHPFIVYSGDILTDIDIEQLVAEHVRRGNDVTMALRKTNFPAGVVFAEGRVFDITRGGAAGAGNYDYANVSVWNPNIFARIPVATKVSFIPILVEWIGQGGRIGGLVLEEGEWFNIGSRAEYLEVHRTIARRQWKPSYVSDPEWPLPVARTAVVEAGARLTGCTVIGEKCRVESGARLDDTIVWAGAQIASRSDLAGCIVRTQEKVEGTYRNTDL
jgi:NDP-sugar pyrophosphorylase family protein